MFVSNVFYVHLSGGSVHLWCCRDCLSTWECWKIINIHPLKVHIVIAIILQSVYSSFFSSTWLKWCVSQCCEWPPSLLVSQSNLPVLGWSCNTASWVCKIGFLHYIWSLLFWINSQTGMICVYLCLYNWTNMKGIICSWELTHFSYLVIDSFAFIMIVSSLGTSTWDCQDWMPAISNISICVTKYLNVTIFWEY